MPRVSSELPTSVQMLILERIHIVYRENGDWPNNSELLEAVNQDCQMGQQQLTNYKGFLRDKRLIRDVPGERYALTPKGFEALGYNFMPAEIVIRGEVKAGPSGSGDLVVDEFIGEGLNTLSVPGTDPGKETYALEVVGTSMENEHIQEGDYVIIQSYVDNTEVREGDLIVTRYLPETYNDVDEEVVLNVLDDLSEYEGPTLKYCYIIRDPKSRRYLHDGKVQTRKLYQLSQRKVKRVDGEVDKQSTIYTLNIKPMGKVIGVYRVMKR